ncbi:hypothetical protein CRENBAI_021163 [Crenichthys baileyi]|uniref:Uncharacterized protein n=1 Tax=Crenichthys baileyi TaxID=28760 RepID=A0AAV9SNS4_9TELE
MFPPNLDLVDGKQESARDHWVQQQMKEAMRYLPTDVEVLPSPLLLEQMERRETREGPASSASAPRHSHRKDASAPVSDNLADISTPPHSGQATEPSSAKLESCKKEVDLFSYLSREADKTLRHSAGLPLPQSAYDGSRKRRRGAPSYFSASEDVGPMSADVWAAASNPASSPATALSARLPAPLPKPSSHSPGQDSVATPDELEECLRFYARQIKSFRRASLLFPSPELMEKIRQMEEDYWTAVSRTTEQPTPGLHGAAAAGQSRPGLQSAAAVEQPTPGLHGAAAAEQPTAGLQGAAATAQPMSRLQNKAAAKSTSCLQSAAIVPPKSASTSSTRRRGRWKRDASAQVIGGPADASAQATEGLSDASASVHATERLGDPLGPAPGLKAFQGFSERLDLVLVPEPCDEGFEDEPPPDPVPERSEEKLVLIMASEPRDEGFEEEAPLDPVSEGFKEQLVLVLASKGSLGSVPVSEDPVGAASASEGPVGSVPVSEGPVDSVPVSEGSPGSASASEGSPGSASGSEGSPGSVLASEGSPGTVKPGSDSEPDSKPPESHRVPGGSSMLHGQPPDLPSRGSSTLLGRPPDRGSSTLLGHPPDRRFLRRRPPTLLFSHHRFPDQLAGLYISVGLHVSAAKVSKSLLASLSSPSLSSPAAKFSTSLLATLSLPPSLAAKVSTSLLASTSLPPAAKVSTSLSASTAGLHVFADVANRGGS